MTTVFECTECSHRTFYEKHRCLNCGTASFTTVPAGKGTLLAYTIVHVTPEGVSRPNHLGLATFTGGANVIAQLEGEPTIGETVHLIADKTLRVTNAGTLTGYRLAAVK